ncbi:DNA repair protein [Burkholderia phage BcepSauron]|uniref:DNA repair protein n=1 Tax=Burkholderia phage BcepSauron TaxID=2530033 RepID=A0A482MKX3_9CAUD|nr:DNA repair protein [Burkholderia phage BcepSauron]QBQ74677.1 DNA repair protein [Burkholderia phage BcepSauron]
MHHIYTLLLEKVGPFQKRTVFNIPPGVSTIYGLNRASGKASKNSNGVGKSFLLSMIPEIIHDVPQLGEKSDRVKQGIKELRFKSHGGKEVIARRASRGKTDKLELSINGKEKEIRTVAEAKRVLARLFPLTEADYRTYVSIDARVPHPLVMGSGAERKAFLTEFFGLDKLDAERKLYVAELSKLSKVRAAYDELRAQIERAREDLLDRETLDRLKKRAATIKKKLSALQALFTEAQETTRLVAFAESMGPQVGIIQNAIGEITEESFADHVAQIKYEYEQTKANIEEAEAYEQYKKDVARYNEALSKVSESTQSLVETSGRDLAVEMAKNAYDAYMQLQGKVRVLEAQVAELQEEVDAELPERVKRPDENEADLETLVRVYEHQIEHAEKFSEGKCETCGQTVVIKDPKVLAKRLKIAKQKLSAHAKYEAYRKARAAQQKAEVQLNAAQSELGRVKAQQKKHRANAKAHRELAALPPEPEEFTGKKLELKVLRRMLEEITERRSLLRQLADHLDTIIAIQKLKKSDMEIVKRAEEAASQMSDLQERLSSAQAKIEMHRTVRARIADMKERVAEMEAQLAEEEALKHLVQGFQDKNLKKMAIEAISQRLMVLINRYASRVFPEAFQFEFQWDTDIRIIVHRPNGKEPSDVRKLSGAEAAIFTLVIVCALLNFVPDHKRCSLMVLDEPDAHMSPEMAEAMYNVVKILNTMVPSIVIITPKTDRVFQDSKPFTIVKDASGDSRIVEGFPHEVK